ncbi:MAG: hypothetical protein AAFQ80_25215, partial [Cyanobacteria bacterium J06621_8]
PCQFWLILSLIFRAITLVKVVINSSQQQAGTFSTKFSIYSNQKREQFKEDFRKKYEQNKNINQDISLQNDKATKQSQGMIKLEEDLMKFLEKTDCREICFILNLGASTNIVKGNSSETTTSGDNTKQSNNTGIGNMSGGKIQGNADVGGEITNNAEEEE